jgi:hypothetical protein
MSNQFPIGTRVIGIERTKGVYGIVLAHDNAGYHLVRWHNLPNAYNYLRGSWTTYTGQGWARPERLIAEESTRRQ